jgi:hypothetical protein
MSSYSVTVNYQPLPPEAATTILALLNNKIKFPTSFLSTPTQKPSTIMLHYTHPGPLSFSLTIQPASDKINVNSISLQIKPSHTNSDPTIPTYPNHAIPRPNTSQAYMYTQIKIINIPQHLSSISQNIGFLETKKNNHSSPLHYSYTWLQNSGNSKLLILFQPKQTYYIVPICLFLALGET